MKIIDGDVIGLISSDIEDGSIVEKRKYIFRLKLEDGTVVDIPAVNIGKEDPKKKALVNQSGQFKKLKKQAEDIDEEDIDEEDIDEEDSDEDTDGVPDVDEEEGSYI